MERTKRPLSYFAANRCETACKPRCRCRCGGKLHGAQRGSPDELPPDDPHYALDTANPDPAQMRRLLERAGQLALGPDAGC